MKKVAFKVLGCKVNTYEVEAVYQEFKNNGYTKVDINEIADVYVINTCSVTNTGDKKSRQAIRKCIKLNPDAIIVVMGCYSQLQTKEVQEIEGVDIILGTQGREELMNHIKEYEIERLPQVHVSNIMKTTKFENMNTISYESQTRAFLKIQEGCNNFCTFCIIPWARGLMRSQSPEVIIEQTEKLVENGVKEIVLTGIHTGGYGEDLEDFTFTDLLTKLDKINGLERIRISSIEITQLDDDFIEFLKKSKKIVNHLHVPIQSGSDKILKKMKRNYTIDFFEKKVNELRSIFPTMSFTTDIIVGFPGETDEDFHESLENIKKININGLHVFPYSKRNGTPAAKMENQVDDNVKKDRVKKLLNLSKELTIEYNKKFNGKTLEVLIERKTDDGYYVGYSTNYIKVKVKSENIIIGNIYNINVIDIKEDYVLGKIL